MMSLLLEVHLKVRRHSSTVQCGAENRAACTHTHTLSLGALLLLHFDLCVLLPLHPSVLEPDFYLPLI